MFTVSNYNKISVGLLSDIILTIIAAVTTKNENNETIGLTQNVLFIFGTESLFIIQWLVM